MTISLAAMPDSRSLHVLDSHIDRAGYHGYCSRLLSRENFETDFDSGSARWLTPIGAPAKSSLKARHYARKGSSSLIFFDQSLAVSTWKKVKKTHLLRIGVGPIAV